MEIKMVLFLPRDASSVPVSRQVLDGCLETLGVTEDTRTDIALALGEACANVVQHAGPHNDYEVRVDLDDHRCRIQVTDQGEGFDPSLLTEQLPADVLDGGTGLRLMRALVDTLQFEQDAEGRHRVTFVKRLASRQPLSVPPL